MDRLMDVWLSRWKDGSMDGWVSGMWIENKNKPGVRQPYYCVTSGKSTLFSESHIAHLENGISVPGCAQPKDL